VKKRNLLSLFCGLLCAGLLTACGPGRPPQAGAQAAGLRVLAVETFLADMAQNVAGDRLHVEALVPVGLDPHAFEPTPQDVARLADSDVILVNGAGFEAWLERTLENAGGDPLLVEAAAGLESRTAADTEPLEAAHAEDETGDVGPHASSGPHASGDPHFWLDPVLAVRYVENIRDGLSAADPEGREVYARNAAAYIEELEALDAWIREQVEGIPPERRLLVTNHESFGYFADRYGFRLVGAVLPGVSTGAAPSAQAMAALVERIREAGVKAVFLETGTEARIARAVAAEAGVTVVTELYSHSVTGPDGPAPTYIEMLKTNTRLIVEALK
jgi:ABC-type Zn uptake system ZnuABC Zn-binding protein ZnuA